MIELLISRRAWEIGRSRSLSRRLSLLILKSPGKASLIASRQSMLHFEFGRDRLAEPHALKAFELGQRAIECAFEGCFVAEHGSRVGYQTALQNRPS